MNGEPHTQGQGMVAPATERRHALRPADAGVVPADALTVRAEISDRQIEDMITLYRQWAEEENRVFNREVFVDHVLHCLGQGILAPIVLVSGDVAVGAVMLTFYRDLFSGELGCMGDQLYVVPAYRGHGALRLVFEACQAFAEAFDASLRRIPMKPGLEPHWAKLLPADYRKDTIIYSAEV